jgi:mannitol-1-phosphate 5-dehydrogenase
LAKGLEIRSKSNPEPINIIIAENVLKGEEVLYNLLAKEMNKGLRNYLDKNVGLVQAVVSRMVPVLPQELKEKDLLYIKAEEYRELPVDRNAFKGEIPNIAGMKPHTNFEAYEERKLFIHNTCHAIAAYLGSLKGYKYIYEAMGDRWIKGHLREAVKALSAALIKKHPFLKEELKSYVEDLYNRFSNKALADTVTRVARDPLRKLALQDRLVGACRFVEKYGKDPAPVSLGISACLLYNEENDDSSKKLQEMISKKGIGAVLSELCHIKRGERLYRLVIEGYNKLKEG